MSNHIFEEIDNAIHLMQAAVRKRIELNPTFYEQYKIELLTEASIADIDDILSRWKLPESYVYFLKHYVPMSVAWETEDYIQLEIYGAAGLREGQLGYNYNPVTQEEITDWPKDYLVIASDEGDPYCIDLSRGDTVIYTAVHGQGEWDFSIAYDSLEEFLYSALLPRGLEVDEPSDIVKYNYYKLWITGEGSDRVKTLLFIKKNKKCDFAVAKSYLADVPLLVYKGIEQGARQIEGQLKSIGADYTIEQISFEEFVQDEE
ncbi:SMI1 / KNR4 family protein [compost metagenome]